MSAARDPYVALLDAGRRAPQPRRPAEVTLVWFEDIEPDLSSRDFVQGLLEEAAAAVVYGDSNAGKTFWATDLALHVAAGREWNGRRVEQGAVIYCVLEGGKGFRNRVSAWRARHMPDGGRIPFAAIQAGLNLLDPEADVPLLIQRIQAAARRAEMPVKLVVIDTLARAFVGGNENSSEDMGALVLNMDEIRRATGACVLFIHHSGKDQDRGARGHSSLRAAIDTEIEVIADEESGARSATVVKQREMQKGEVFGFGLDVVELGKNRHGEAVTTCVVVPAQGEGPARKAKPLSADQARAFEVLTDLIARQGVAGFGVPHERPSVPEEWWRDRFYDRAKAGANEETKRKAFRRAADTLVQRKLVEVHHGRVWVP